MSPARKNLLMAACALGVLYLAWLATNVMKLLPPGPWTAWYVGFGILGVATVMSAIALRREAPPGQSRPQQNTATKARTPRPLSSSSKPVKRLTRQTPRQPNEPVHQPEDLRSFNARNFEDDNTGAPQRAHQAAHEVPSAAPFIPKITTDQPGLMLTPLATPEPPEPISFDEPSMGDYTPETSTLAQWIQSHTDMSAKATPDPSTEAQQHGLLAEAVPVGAQRPTPPRKTLTGLNASLTEPTYDHGAQDVAVVTANTTPSLDDNIKIMTSFGQRAEKSAAEQAFEDASLSSIDAAIKQYTVELYDMGDDDQLSRTLDEVLNIGSLSQAAQPHGDDNPSNDLMTDTKRLRLEALKNKLSAPSQAKGGDLESLLSAATGRASSLPERPAAATTPQPYMNDSQAESAPQDIHGVVLEPFTQGLGAMDRDEVNRLWQDYAEASVSCGRPPARISYVRFYQQLIQHHETISRQYDCENIRFRIKIKNGKPALSARPA